MFRNATITLTMLAASVLAASPAMAESGPEGEAREGKVTNGAFELTLNGEVPEDMSFYIEANFGSGSGVICTTDAAMVRAGYAGCAGNGAINEMPFVAPAGSTIEYRVLGSRGVELSQRVIAEGTEVASEGLVIDASYTLPGDFAVGDPAVSGGASPEDRALQSAPAKVAPAEVAPAENIKQASDGTTEVPEDNAASAAHDQYEQYEDIGVDAGDDDALIVPDAVEEDVSSEDGVSNVASAVPVAAVTRQPSGESSPLKTLPDTGGTPALLLVGGALLAAAGLVFRRMI